MSTEINITDAFMSRMKENLETARSEFHLAVYLSECGSNAGLRTMWSNKADWLSSVIYLAEYGLTAIEAVQNTSYKEPEEMLSKTICMDSGPNQFQTIMYKPTCPHGYDDCVWDPAYIYATYPGWYSRLYGDVPPEEVCCENCTKGERYDDEDK